MDVIEPANSGPKLARARKAGSRINRTRDYFYAQKSSIRPSCHSVWLTCWNVSSAEAEDVPLLNFIMLSHVHRSPLV